MSQQLYEFLRLLSELGLFSDTTALVYSLLLIEGHYSKAQIVNRTLRDKQEIETSLKKLIELRLVNRDREQTGFKYYATNPSVAWLSLETELIWRLDTSLRAISDIQNISSLDAEDLRKKLVAIKQQAQQIYKPQIAILNHKENDVQTNEEFAQILSEMISQARKQIFAVSKSPRLKQVSLFWTALTERIRNGVQYTRIVDLEEIVEHGLKIVRRDIQDYGIELLVLEQNQINHKFYIVDKKYIAIFHGNSQALEATDRGFGRLTRQHEIINRYRKRFQKYKNQAMPGLFVLEHMEESAS